MKWSVISLLGAVALFCAPSVSAQSFPRMTKAEPSYAMAGELVSVTGENLAKKDVSKVYLTDGKDDIELALTEQTGTEVKFKVPGSVTAKRFTLMILTPGPEPRLIEQPCKLTVETAEERSARKEHEAELAKDAEPQPAAPAKPQTD
jgi:hypothetical protein